MSVNKGLKSLAESSPNFSNQGLENAINALKKGWVIKSFELDQVITNNIVLTDSQKTDVKDTINNVAYLNLGRTLGDLLRHTNSILDGTIVFLQNPDTEDTADFLEILQTVQSLQTLIPNLYGVSAAEKSRDVNDHLGTLNNIFLETEDSSAPVFTSLAQAITFITNANLATESALESAYDTLKDFINSMTDDSTDTQHRSPYLGTYASAVASAHTNFNNALASEPYLTKRTQLLEGRDKINTQVALENRNLSGIRNYSNDLTNYLSYTSLAEEPTLRQLMTRISQSQPWITYFENYVENVGAINPIYNINTDSDKSAIIDQVLRDSGLPDVVDYLDLEAVADKSERDDRIDTKNYDRYTTEQRITKSCEQLGLVTTNRSIYDQSQRLLNNMNQHDRDKIARQLDLNESSNTLS